MSDSYGEATRSIAKQLLKARRNASVLPQFPDALPTSLADAYAVQNCALSQWDDTVAGWKVGGIPPQLQQQFGADKVVGPIFAKSVRRAESGQCVTMPAFAAYVAIEVELIIEMGETRDDDRMFIGVEIASSPIQHVNKLGLLAVASDFGINGGLLVGPEVKNWRSVDFSLDEVKAVVGGEVYEPVRLTQRPDAALYSMAALEKHCAQYGIDLPAGTFVSSGAITGVHETRVGSRTIADFGRLGSVEIVLSDLADTL
jgi:2-keto-4-pentenoate hydratase